VATVTHGITTNVTTNASSYVSNAFTPAVNDLLVAFVFATGTTDVNATLTNSRGTTFTKVGQFAVGGGADLLYCFIANSLVVNAVSQTCTFACPADAATGHVSFIARVAGMQRVGLDAARQFSGQANQAAGTPAPAFPAAALTGNAVIGCVGVEAVQTAVATPPANFTELGDAGYATPTSGAEYAARNSGHTSATVTWGAAVGGVFGSIIIELDTTAPTPATNAPAELASGSGQAYDATVQTTGGVTPPSIRQENAANATATSNNYTFPGGAAPVAGNAIVMCFSGDKNPGAIGIGPGTWNVEHDLHAVSTTDYMAWKVSDGTEGTTGNPIVLTQVTPGGGGVGWIGEVQQSGTGSWAIAGKAANPNPADTTTANAWSTGTTGTLTHDGLAIASISCDTVQSGDTGSSWTNGYVEEYRNTGTGAGLALLLVGRKAETAGVTTETTATRTGTPTADQMSGAVIVLGRASAAPSTNAPAEVASGTGEAPDPVTVAIGVPAELAAGSGTALDASVSTATATNAPAEAASGSGSALDATVAVGPAVELASGSGTAPDATVSTAPPAGANATVRSVGADALSTGSVTSILVPLPSDPVAWQPGDLVLIPATSRASGGGLGAAPTGWSAIVANFESGSNASGHMALYGRIMQAGDTAPTITLASGRVAAKSIAVKDHGLANLGEVIPTNDNNGASASANIVAPSVTPPWASSLLLAFFGATHSTNGTTWQVNPPGGMTEVLDIATSVAAATNAGIAVASEVLSGTTASGTRTGTTASGTSVNATGISVTIRPSPTAAPSTNAPAELASGSGTAPEPTAAIAAPAECATGSGAALDATVAIGGPPQVRAVTSGGTTGTTTQLNHDLTIPTCAVGDLLHVAITLNTAHGTITEPARLVGSRIFPTTITDDGANTLLVYERTADATDVAGGTWRWTTGAAVRSNYGALSASGAGTPTAPTVGTASVANVSTQITTPNPDCLVISTLAIDSGTENATPTAPLVERWDPAGSGTATGQVNACATAPQNTQGAQTYGWTWTNALPSKHVLVAVRPVGAAVAVNAPAELAAGSGTALDATVATTANAELASGSGAAPDATVSTVTSTAAPAELASGSGQAYDATVAVGPAAEPATGSGSALDPSVATVAGTVTHLWAGGSTTDGFVVVPDMANTTSARLKVSTTSDLLTAPVFFGPVAPDAQGYARLVATGLAAGTQYFYRVESNGTLVGATGSCRTAPATASSFSFVFGSCHNDDAVPGSWTRAKARNPDFLVLTGDFPYIDIATNDPAGMRTDRENSIKMSTVQPMLRDVPSFYIWSDHDYGGNNADGTSASKPAANLVYRQQVPYPGTLPATDGCYHTFTWGRCRFVMLDCRAFKSPIGDVDNASKTMLGATQKAWAKNVITTATEPLIFVVSDVPWVGSTLSDDEWTGYSTERAEMGAFFAASGKRVIILAGDAHMLAADDGRNSVGSVPVLQAAPWRQTGSVKGGPYSAGTYIGSGTVEQYGHVAVTDSGSGITVAFTGYDTTDVARISLTIASTFPELASGSGSAPDAGVIAATATNAPAEVATGSGQALDARVAVTVSAEIATGSGAAPDATALATGVTNAPAEVATGSGQALDATVRVGPAAELAAGSGAALEPAAAVAAPAELPTGTGSALDTRPAVTTAAELAAGSGAALDASTSTVAITQAPAEVATGSGAALDARVAVASGVEVAAGTGQALDVGAFVGVAAELPTGSGAALDATVSYGRAVSPEAATGSGSALDARVAVAPAAELAALVGLANDAEAQTISDVRLFAVHEGALISYDVTEGGATTTLGVLG
jgi:PhoD-like phosphatase